MRGIVRLFKMLSWLLTFRKKISKYVRIIILVELFFTDNYGLNISTNEYE
jgi:hypothetical protein